MTRMWASNLGDVVDDVDIVIDGLVTLAWASSAVFWTSIGCSIWTGK